MREEATVIYRLNRQIQILLAIFPIFIATLIYILFRDENIYLVSILNKGEHLSYIRKILDAWSPIKNILPEWVIYSLPDGLWSISFYSVVSIFIGKEIALTYYLILFLLIILLEIGQLFNFINGTYDFTDVMMYVISFSFYFSISFYHKFIHVEIESKNEKI
jgi:hypothetical protein